MRFWLIALAALALTACWKPVNDYNCLLDGGCECIKQDQCPQGWDCIDGFCKQLPDAGPPGDVGKPCTQDADCLFPLCLPKGPGNGQVCSAECNADGGTACPHGWACKQRLDSSAYACVPPFHALCLSCRTDSDCNAEGDRCVSGADGGGICGEDCSLFPCPDGYECRGVPTDGGLEAHQCLPPSLSCDCSAINVGLKRSCKNSNAMATCFGFETCKSDGGFSACDARSASPEQCNGIDDDCNGLTDDADPTEQHPDASTWPDCTRGTTCKGAFYCGRPPDAGVDAGYDFQCSAPPILPEKCNGLDDNCNGAIDEDFKDNSGNFSSPLACGSCALDCTVSIPNLFANDAGAVVSGAVDCLLADAGPRCIPKQCAPGFYPWPPGLAELCQPVTDTECRPCTVDGDCGVPGDVCTTLSNDVGSYCLQSCDSSSPHLSCPMGSSCQAVSGAKRCVPDDQSCSCTPARVGFTRSCTRTFGAALCIGDQVCRADGGFDSCDTSLTAAELCDGLDNDCNGKIDDPFVNTQGSGTYDTDTHCGSCTTNCIAQWSPTIQHAVGGCRLSFNGGPLCRIVQCTSGTQPGGKLCQSNADCSGGAGCDLTFHQCEKPCSAGCAAGEVCQNGGCTQACTTDVSCVNAYGASSSCGDAGACVNNYQFVNADLDPTNGCECPAIAGAIDTPDLYPTYPGVGVTYVDRDCDGVDGTTSRSIFVNPRSTSSQGTKAAPYKTIAEAIAGFDPNRFDAILVAQGTYVEQVVMTNGVNLYGGYSPDFSKRDVITYPSLIEAPQPDFTLANSKRGTVNAEGLTSPSTLAGFTIRGYDVLTRPTPGNNALNSYAVYVSGSSGLTLANNHIVGGRGADAVPAAPGQVGSQGSSGTKGLDAKECASTDCSGETQSGGSGGSNASCGAASGNPGAGANPLNNPQDYQAPGGINGTGGANAVYQHSNSSQSQLCKYDCTVPSNGLDGLPASNGGDGSAGSKGNGCSLSFGAVSGGEWSASGSVAGVGGAAGIGAGGGGAGGCVMNMNPASCTIGHRVGDLGATGGGGGAGGCGGTGGKGGGGGGGSFAVFIVGAAPKMFGNLIEPGFGGAGGTGGAGGYGGLGGPGGSGGQNNALAWCAGIGGAGGRGGNGGPGGGGGGGCGGISVGVAGVGIASLGYDTQNTLVSPPLQAGGPGGAGGPSPAGASSGSTGAQGSADTLRSF